MKAPYIRCFWSGRLYLTNGMVMSVHCTHISSQQIEVEAPYGSQGSKLVKLELNAIHEGKTALIKALCKPLVDVLNEHNKHYIRLSFHKISSKDLTYIKTFIEDNS
ncbi:hypothetical protein MSP8886_03807 [Marinomonas spartinae]|uniref:PilZ domain-containing protein n=1 Tax=Marinomonas spartinae TaxID=1792290 RepID=A0A1A8TQM6_9GAMM|nr:hypothetical protein [Marinomonas spartinae]SBS36688.1 hypothetical protein MSP8886_03807 [Marinomonas spartinae]